MAAGVNITFSVLSRGYSGVKSILVSKKTWHGLVHRAKSHVCPYQFYETSVRLHMKIYFHLCAGHLNINDTQSTASSADLLGLIIFGRMNTLTWWRDDIDITVEESSEKLLYLLPADGFQPPDR
ncbi:hypothetical protein EVAR_700_1 [Eumeta japonica]|uniref:Uncharacterized protein n=1 Tax=Eumeta variegata TaxID=151549 RepID=A0A4C1SBV7_EUMVA|nr:hypothetical protein EVAR_700_1 [Eumeta japonica]